MFGKIYEIDGKKIIVENMEKISLIDAIGLYVLFEGKYKLVGRIKYANEFEFITEIIGEIKNNAFFPGTQKIPTRDYKCRMLNKVELEYIIGSQDILLPQNLLLGKSNIYDGFNISVNIDELLSSHLTVIGNTGSGKSCGVARLFQNMFSNNKKNPLNSHIIIFDVYGEYKSSLLQINNYDGINVKNMSTGIEEQTNEEIIRIPPYLLEVDDLALLLNIEDVEMIPTLEKALRYVYIFKNNSTVCNQCKNEIIAKTLLDILSSGKSANQLRNQVIAFLNKFNTQYINIRIVINEQGYSKTIEQCLNIDNQGKMSSLDMLINYLQKFLSNSYENIAITKIKYTLEDLYNALEFATISEGLLTSKNVNEKLNVMKNRLYSILTGNKRIYFEYNDFVSMEEYVKSIFSLKMGESAQIVDVSFNDIDDRFAKVIVKILAKMFYKFTSSLENRGSYPINIFIEEAHRYIYHDNDVNIIGYNIFDRIAKEGRKYGVLLVLITQRINELSATVLSQCSNFFIFKMCYPEDIAIISSLSSKIGVKEIGDVKNLRPGSALVFGTAFKLPLIVHFALPNPMPTSNSIDLCNAWFES